MGKLMDIMKFFILPTNPMCITKKMSRKLSSMVLGAKQVIMMWTSSPCQLLT